MKPTLLLPLRRLAWVGCLVLTALSVRAQDTPSVAQQVDINYDQPKLITLDRPIDSFSITPENVVRVTKVDGTPNELSLEGVNDGNAKLTVKSDGRTLAYDLAVSPAPERLYINLNESKRLTFSNPIDDTSLSQTGIVKVVQPDSADNVLLIEADVAGKTTLTVYVKSQIYRYFISTFDNRGADVLEIENAFSAKGYRNLTVTFDKDQAVLSGTVPTQEELDDAVNIIKQYTQFVQVKATLGQDAEESEYTEQEALIIANIQRIADVPGLTVRVKFPAPTVITTSSYIKSTGDYINPTTTTTPQGGTIRGSGFTAPTRDPNTLSSAADLEPKPQQNTTETVTTTEDSTIPEKIFLYGDIQDDLQEARIIRVARTFCPFIVNFLTIRDPIQLRTQIRFMQVTNTSNKDTGVFWSGNGPEGGPTVTLGFGNSMFNYLGTLSAASSFSNLFTGAVGVAGSLNAQAQLELFQSLNVAKLMQQTQLFLTNGQPGWYSEGEVRSYVASTSISISTPPIETITTSAVFLGVNMDIAPLNITQSGGAEPSGQKIFGIPGSIGVGSGGSSGYTLETNTDNSADQVSRITTPIQKAGNSPIIDDSVKYVDENGLIGMDLSTQLSIPNGTFQTVQFGAAGQFITLPDFFVRTTRTRVNLRDSQSVVINGLIDEQTTRAITSVPFLQNIPIFGALFRNPVDFKSHEEVIVLVTPHIVRMRDPDSSRFPKPAYPETEDLAREKGEIPIIKPVPYDDQADDADHLPMDHDSKDAKDAQTSNNTADVPGDVAEARESGENSTDIVPEPGTMSHRALPVTDNDNTPAPQPLRPHVIGAMKPMLEPPSDAPIPAAAKPHTTAVSSSSSSTASSTVSSTARANDNIPAGTGLTPNSTLP
jgi:Flp pilus assembly secretin CpaC